MNLHEAIAIVRATQGNPGAIESARSSAVNKAIDMLLEAAEAIEWLAEPPVKEVEFFSNKVRLTVKYPMTQEERENGWLPSRVYQYEGATLLECVWLPKRGKAI